MKVIKATGETVEAIRRMGMVIRDHSLKNTKKQSGFYMESGSGTVQYSGPFMCGWYSSTSNLIQISCPPEYMGGLTTYSGSICTPDMQILTHVPAGSVEVSSSAGLVVLVINFNSGGTLSVTFKAAADPWSTCSDADKNAAVDALNPVTESYPHRDPRIGIYPIARVILNERKIIQLQQGHITDYSRWWRL